MKIISVRNRPEYAEQAISYFQEKWASDMTKMLYQDAINRSIDALNPLPQWYILLNNDQIIGCAGLITNDFISRMELYPWLCALHIESDFRGQGLARQLIDHIALEAKLLGFSKLHLCTDLEGFYERVGFLLDGVGYHPWGEFSSVYSRILV